MKAGDFEGMVGQHDERAEVIEIGVEGRLIPHPEWNDHALDASELMR